MVCAQHPAARCYAVGHVGKFFWPQFIKFRHQRMFYQFRVQLGYTVYWKRADNRKICHADNLIVAFAVHNRNFAQFVRIFAKTAAGKFHKAAVDFINNLQMARQKAADNGAAPFFQGFWQQCVVCIGKNFGDDFPRVVPFLSVYIHQLAHHFHNCQSRVGVV